MENAQKNDVPQGETRYDLLKKASLEHYQTGISLKQAAKNHNLTFPELKYFYETTAGEFLGRKGYESESDEDP